jgi:sugar transferase (PEP-CTERM/EpsH1 system associated)
VKVLFLTHRLPYAPNRGDRARAYHIIRTLAPLTEMHVGSLVHDDHEAAQLDRVRALGATVYGFRVPKSLNYIKGALSLAGTRPLTHSLLDSPDALPTIRRIVAETRPDVVLALCSSMAKFALMPPLESIPLVIDMIDVDSVKWAMLSKTARWPLAWVFRREHRRLGAFERLAATHAKETLVVNEREAEALRALTPVAKIRVVQIGVDFDGLHPQSAPVSEPRLVFCGVMNYTPNVEGILWFVREVWPLIRTRYPAAEFLIVGAEPAEVIRRLAASNTGITVTGTVPDVRPFLWKAAVGVAPLQTARGVQNKVLESVAAGLPSVVTSPVFEGLPVEVHPACSRADTVADFAERALDLLALSADARRALAASANLRPLTWESQTAPVYDVLATAIKGSSQSA